jgi:hypothetical protein
MQLLFVYHDDVVGSSHMMNRQKSVSVPCCRLDGVVALMEEALEYGEWTLDRMNCSTTKIAYVVVRHAGKVVMRSVNLVGSLRVVGQGTLILVVDLVLVGAVVVLVVVTARPTRQMVLQHQMVCRD